MTPDTVPPTVPANVTATAVSSSQITVSWSASSDPGGAVAGYYVYRGDLGTTPVTTTTATSFTNMGLTARTVLLRGGGLRHGRQRVRAIHARRPSHNAGSPGRGWVRHHGRQWLDEYRADADKGGAYAATTFNWMELLARYRGLDFGPWETDAFPRLTGYAYNWSSSGATSASVISDGQAAGIAQQVAAGKVGRAVLMIGSNDIQPIAEGTVTGSAVTTLDNSIIANITQAMDIVLQGGRSISWS